MRTTVTDTLSHRVYFNTCIVVQWPSKVGFNGLCVDLIDL